MRHLRLTPTALAMATLLACFSGATQAAGLTFSCPANPPAGTTATLAVSTSGAWTVDGDATWDALSPGIAPTTRIFQHSMWASVAGRPGQWISINEQATPGSFFFRSADSIDIDPSKVDVASISASVVMSADNYLPNFLVKPDGQPQVLHGTGSATPSIFFQRLSTQSFAGNLGFQSGSNHVGLEVRNHEPTQGGGASPIGVYGEITLTATCLPTPPGPVDDTYPMTPGQTSLSDNVGGNDTLPGTPEWSLLTPPPANTGNLVFNPDGSFTFTPAPGFSGPVDFSYQLCSGPNATAPCAPAKVHITVPPAPVAPAPVNDSFSVTPGQALSASVTGNDQNVPATPEWSLVTPPPAADGTLVFNPDGTFTFTPAIGFTGPTTFTYQLCSGPGQTAPCTPATVTLSPAGSVAPVPGLGGWALLGLTAMLAGLGVRRKRAI